ncbi:MAG: acetyl-CoA carboxylase carboxyl transferase subunit alpha [Campylobacterales bacterium]
MAVYLDFESKIKTLQEEIASATATNDKDAEQILNKELQKEVDKTFKSLNPYQKLQLARHPDRPYTKDYIDMIATDIVEVHGDRLYKDDPSIITAFVKIDGVKTLIIGEEKGRGTKNKIYRNFGMPNPEGYRKALRVAKLAEKFGLPILMLVDTPGAYPGIGAEERGQSEAIARNLYEFSKLRVPTVSVVIGEGGSGGALAISVADKLAMMRYSVYSVISPEGCAAILWKDPQKVEQATKALKISADDLKDEGLIDDIINEPLIGAYRDKEAASRAIKSYFLESLSELQALSTEELLDKRYKSITSKGKYIEF